MASPKLASAPTPTPTAEAPVEAPPHKNLAAALLAAQKQVKSVTKSSSNEYDRYAYTSSDTMIGACGEALNDNGLVLSQEGHEIDDSKEPPRVVLLMLLEYPETGEERRYQFKWPVVGNPKRIAAVDKALAGAITTALGYFQRGLLNVRRADPNEMDKREDVDHEPPKAGPTKESSELQAEIVSKMGLLREKQKVDTAATYYDRAGHDVKLLRQVRSWIEDKIEKQGAAPEKGAEPVVEKVDPRTGEVLDEYTDPESPLFGMARGEDGP